MHYKTKFRGFKVRKGLVSKIISSHNWGARGPEPTHIYTHTFCRLPPPLLASSRPIAIVVLRWGIPELELTAVHHWSNT